MKAVRLNAWNTPVQIEEIPRPEPAEDEALVRVHAASINRIDQKVLTGAMASIMSLPRTVGTDFAGEVVSTGSKVQHIQPGDLVYGMILFRGGAFAEYAVPKNNEVALKPAVLDFEHAAAVPLTGLTAWQGLFEKAHLKSGERVLIHGAGGSVGMYAVQLAKNAGAYVIATDLGVKEGFVRKLGADEFIDVEKQDFTQAAGSVDVVFDLVGGDATERFLSVMKPGSRYVSSAAHPSEDAGKNRGIEAMGMRTQPTVEDLRALAEVIDAGKVKVYIGKVFPIEQAAEALAYKVSQGKVVLKID